MTLQSPDQREHQHNGADEQRQDHGGAAAALKPHHRAPRRNEVATIAGRRVIPITERLTLNIPPALAVRLADMTLRTGWSAERLILDLLDDALPAPSRSIHKGQG